MKKKIILAAACAMALPSCYKELDLEKYRPESKLVLNCAASPDTVIMAGLSRTWFFPDGNPDTRISGATVALYVNGVFAEQMGAGDAAGIYVSSVTPRTGDVVRVAATVGDETAWAEDTIPQKIEIEKIETSVQYEPRTYGTLQRITYQITFSDPPEEDNYYFVRIESGDDLLAQITFAHVIYVSPVFAKQQENAFDEMASDEYPQGFYGRTFTDELIKGQKYTLTIRQRETYAGEFQHIISLRENIEMKIMLYSVSKSYYHYLSALIDKEDAEGGSSLADAGMAEPAAIYSNITGGTGIFAASQVSVVKLNFKDILASGE